MNNNDSNRPPANSDDPSAIYRRILDDAARNKDEIQRMTEEMRDRILSAPEIEECERRSMAELTSLTNEHTEAVRPLKEQLGQQANNKLMVARLLMRNHDFLRKLAALRQTAAELAARGRPQLEQSVAAWTSETESSIAMMGYILHTLDEGTGVIGGTQPVAKQTSQPLPPPPAPAVLTAAALIGIWDLRLNDGRQVVLSFDARAFSYEIVGGSFAYWGAWSLDLSMPSSPMLAMTRSGGYPVAYYGPLGTVPLQYTALESWKITGFGPGRIDFIGVSMHARAAVPVSVVSAQISQVQSVYMAADARDAQRTATAVQTNKAIADVQGAMWKYINSGAGRFR